LLIRSKFAGLIDGKALILTPVDTRIIWRYFNLDSKYLNYSFISS